VANNTLVFLVIAFRTFSERFPHQILRVSVASVVRFDVVKLISGLVVGPVPTNGPRVLMWSRFFCSTCVSHVLLGIQKIRLLYARRFCSPIMKTKNSSSCSQQSVAGLYRSCKAHFNIILPSVY
jgi:hypothetical protein